MASGGAKTPPESPTPDSSEDERTEDGSWVKKTSRKSNRLKDTAAKAAEMDTTSDLPAVGDLLKIGEVYT